MEENEEFLENCQKRGCCRNQSPPRIFKLQHRDSYYSMRKDHIYRLTIYFCGILIFVGGVSIFRKFSVDQKIENYPLV